jgi:serine/threonine protein kinase
MPSSKKKRVYRRKSYKRKKHSSKCRNSKKQCGGIPLGYGSSGCVIKPNITCGRYVSSDKYVSKLINKSVFSEEFNKPRILGLLRLKDINKYLILPLSYCINLSSVKGFDNDINYCKNKVDSLQNLRDSINIIQEYGGITLYEFRHKYPRISFVEMLPYYKQLLECVKYLNNNGLVHFDIKTPNIVINETTKTLKLIDVGMMAYIDEEKNSKINELIFPFNLEILEQGYYIWPFEIYIYGTMYTRKKILSQINEDVFNNYINMYQWFEYIKRTKFRDKMKFEYIKRGQEYLNKLNNDLGVGGNLSPGDMYKMKTEFNRKLDVFSVGTILMTEWVISYEFKNDSDRAFLDEIAGFIDANMLEQDTSKRMDIDSVYTRFIEICQKYEK